jgi:hypothetical protein
MSLSMRDEPLPPAALFSNSILEWRKRFRASQAENRGPQTPETPAAPSGHTRPRFQRGRRPSPKR